MNTRRVVITGMGIVSCIGNSQNEVLDSLRNGRSGISHSDDYAERGFRSHVHGKPNIDVSDHIDKKLLRFMGDGAAYNYIQTSWPLHGAAHYVVDQFCNSGHAVQD